MYEKLGVPSATHFLETKFVSNLLVGLEFTNELLWLQNLCRSNDYLREECNANTGLERHIFVL